MYLLPQGRALPSLDGKDAADETYQQAVGRLKPRPQDLVIIRPVDGKWALVEPINDPRPKTQ